MSLLEFVLSSIFAVLLAALGELVSDEIRSRLDRIPFLILRAAASRVPLDQRAELYYETWLGELHYILRGDQAMPITRLIHGTRYAFRLWLAASRISRMLTTGSANVGLQRRVIDYLSKPRHTVLVACAVAPITGDIAGWAIKKDSWLLAAGAIALVVISILSAHLVRRHFIRVTGHPLGQRLICQCRIAGIARLVMFLMCPASGISALILSLTTVHNRGNIVASYAFVSSLMLMFISVYFGIIRASIPARGLRDEPS
jgi:hypothetical protein